MDAPDSGKQRIAFEPVQQYLSGIPYEDFESNEDSDVENGDGIESSDGEKILQKELSMRTSNDISDEENYFTSDPQLAERNLALHNVTNGNRYVPQKSALLTSWEFLDPLFNKMRNLPDEIASLSSLISLKVVNNKLVELPLNCRLTRDWRTWISQTID
ncbi:Protein kinase domain-containing protein [Forsythia ovata]|uniref:Protein kinase domain-containing protein n=1 Tax=Forsythia ovata TaxID=205694 RepID=A0ABD1UTQ3_9LAMI